MKFFFMVKGNKSIYKSMVKTVFEGNITSIDGVFALVNGQDFHH